MSPDGSTKPLPEEKLLKLIRDKTARPATATPAAGGRVSLSGSVTSEAAADAAGWRWPILAASGLGLVLVIESMYLVLQLTRPLPTITTPPVPPTMAVEPGPAPNILQDAPSLSQSASPTLFAPPVDLGAPAAGVKPHGAPSASAKLLASRLTLMGIVAGESPQAIIEDSQTKKTFFVTTGQAVVEGAVLEQVLDNRVILDLEGEKIELSL